MDEKNSKGQTAIQMAIEVDNLTFNTAYVKNESIPLIQDVNPLLLYFAANGAKECSKIYIHSLFVTL